MRTLTLEYLRDERKACYWSGDGVDGKALEPRLPMTVAELIADKVIPARDKQWVLLHSNFFTDNELRLLACDFAEAVLPIFEKEYPNDNRPRNAIAVARRFANGDSSAEELAAARDAAWAAAGDAALAAAGAAARDAALAAALAAASAAARDAAWASARDAAWNATWNATWAAQLGMVVKALNKKELIK